MGGGNIGLWKYSPPPQKGGDTMDILSSRPLFMAYGNTAPLKKGEHRPREIQTPPHKKGGEHSADGLQQRSNKKTGIMNTPPGKKGGNRIAVA